MNQTNYNAAKFPARKKGLFLSLLTTLILLLCFAGCSKKTPREALDKAFDKTFTTENPTRQLLGTQHLNEAINEGNGYSSGFSLKLQELSGEGLDDYSGLLSGLGISIDCASDPKNKKSAGTLDVIYGGVTYLTIGGQLDNSKLYFTVPQLLDGSLFVDLATLKEDLASDSVMAQLFALSGLTLPENFSADIADSFFTPAGLTLSAELITAYEELDRAIVVEKAKKETYSLPAEISAKTVYTMTIPQDAYTNLLNAGADYLNGYTAALSDALDGLGGETSSSSDLAASTEALKNSLEQLADVVGDVVLTVAVDKNGYVTYLGSEVITETETLTFSACYTGKSNPLEDISLTFQYAKGDQILLLTYEESFDVQKQTSTFSFGLEIDGDALLTLSGELEYTDIEKGKRYALDINYLEFTLADELTFSFSGSCYLDTTSCAISSPSGTEYELFAMSETEFSALALKIITKIQTDPLLSALLDYLGASF